MCVWCNNFKLSKLPSSWFKKKFLLIKIMTVTKNKTKQKSKPQNKTTSPT